MAPPSSPKPTNSGDSLWDSVRGQELAIQLLELLNRGIGFCETMTEVLVLVKKHTKIEVAGIRLREGEDYPYYVTGGLPTRLREVERSLCDPAAGGKSTRQADCATVLECFCGLVISGQTDPSLSWITHAGSFWSNRAARAVPEMPSDRIPPGFRGRCFEQGYQSIALIPLRCNQEIIGLLQLCDSRPDRLTIEMVRCLESLGASVGIAIRRQQAEDELRVSHDTLEEQVTERNSQLLELNQQLIRESEERRRSEADLELMARFFEETREGIALVDLNGDLIQLNEAFAAMHGYSAAELIGKNLSVFHLPGQLPAVVEANRQLLETGHFDGEVWHARRDGTPFLALMHNTLMRDEQGKPKQMIGSCVDITDRKLAEERLRESLEKLQQSEAHLKRAQQVSQMGSWHWVIEPDDVQWSDEIFRIFGVAPNCFEPSFAAILARTPPDDRIFVKQRVHDILKSEESGDFDQRIVRPCGEVRHLHVQGEAIRDASGKAVEMVGTVIDITERKNAEEALLQTQRLSAIGTLAAGIAHEINNPIGSALLAAETILATKDVPEKKETADRCLQEIVTSLERCGDIVRSVLKFSRDDASERRRIQINDVVRQAIDHSRLYAVGRNVGINLDLGDDLPEVPANHLEMELAVANVIRNALETDGHSRPIEIRTRLTEEGVRIVVQDWASGMTKEVRDRLFDPFFTTRLKKGGTGLGASIAYGIVKSHNGTIQVDSSPGEGTTTSITLPLPDGEPEGDSEEPPTQIA